jgi:3-oxoacyl-[acyl-carrier protein] reductase
MDTNLKGRNAVVCGSSQGIGMAIAIELAIHGANVTLFARDATKLKIVAEQLDISQGQKHGFIVADFNDLKEVTGQITSYCKGGKTAHILVNNSGGPAPGEAIDADPLEFSNAFQRHLLSNQVIVQSLVPAMKKENYGRIINVISTSVKVPIQGLGVSNTIRGAVASWAKTLSSELGPYGITVNNILPGFTKTSRLDSLINSKSEGLGISAKEFEERLKNGIPARRFADPSETAALAVFLASPAAAYINGTSIRVDGGSTPSI